MTRITSPPEPTVGPELHRRDNSIASVNGYRYLGCYSDNQSRILPAAVESGLIRNDPSFCCALCRFQNADFKYCGVENGIDCWCDSATAYSTTSESASKCDSQCEGEGGAACGGFGYMNLYTMTISLDTPTQTTSPTEGKVSGYSYLGCFTDHDNRVIGDETFAPSQMNPQFCCDWCGHQRGGYPICGVEYNNQCYCGSTTSEGALKAPASDCSQGCFGHVDVQCGGLYRLNMYSATGTAATSTSGRTAPGSSSAQPGSSSTQPGSSITQPISSVPTQTSTNSANSDADSGGGRSGLSGGAIAGIVIGSVAAAIALLAAFLFRRRVVRLFQRGQDGTTARSSRRVEMDTWYRHELDSRGVYPSAEVSSSRL